MGIKNINDTIAIVFAVDDNYVEALSTVIVSILQNSKKNSKFEFIIMSKNLSEENKQILGTLRYFNKNISFNFIDMNKVLKNFDLNKFMSVRKDYCYISVETYFRFFIPELLPHHEKVLYLDADILVFKDISELYNQDIDNYYAGVVHDNLVEKSMASPSSRIKCSPYITFREYFKSKLKKDNDCYFNAGVLLLNLKKIREDNVVEKLWHFAGKNRH